MVGSPLTLGAFMPLPLAMMIPFMATQSLVMGEAFGKSYQYGKRKISAMTNEEFNKVTLSSLMMEQTAAIQEMLPELRQQLADSDELQRYIVDAMVKLVPSVISQIGETIGEGLFGKSEPTTPSTPTTAQPGGDRRAGPTVAPTGSQPTTQVPNPESRREQTVQYIPMGTLQNFLNITSQLIQHLLQAKTNAHNLLVRKAVQGGVAQSQVKALDLKYQTLRKEWKSYNSRHLLSDDPQIRKIAADYLKRTDI